jgi:peptidoglycan/LPS O-acetylase OafA/YrhL
LRPTIYGALDQIFAVIYAYAVWKVIPNRLPSASLHLWSLPVLAQLMALGALAVWVPRARKIAWWVAVIAGSALLASSIVLILRIVVSAAFLAGTYGAFGKAAASTAMIGAALVVELVALLPLFQVKYLMSRAGRRAFGR